VAAVERNRLTLTRAIAVRAGGNAENGE
jgi:hypothetical protein